MNNNILKIALVALAMSPIAAFAVPIQSSTTGLVTFRDCVPGATACDSVSGVVQNNDDGLPGNLSSSAFLSDDTYGAGQTVANFTGPASAPFLGVFSQSLDNKRVGANAAAVQRYTYTGLTPTMLTFNGLLEYITGEPPENLTFPDNNSGNETSVFSQIAIFTLDDLTVDVGTTVKDNFNSLFFGDPFTAAPGFNFLGLESFGDSVADGQDLANLGITFSVNPGDSFWAYGLLQGSSVNGGSALAFLETSFENSEFLVPANGSAVPEPGTLALLGLGLAGMGFARRKKA